MPVKHNNEEALQRKEQLLAARADLLRQMSPAGQRALEEQSKLHVLQKPTPARSAAEAHGTCHDGLLTDEIRNLIAEAHKLRSWAEERRDIKTALKGLDSALRALELYGRATGQIRDQRSPNVTVNVVATREEGLETAAELLLDLATPNELKLVIAQLQQRLSEIETLKDLSSALPPAQDEAMPPQLPAALIIDGKEED